MIDPIGRRTFLSLMGAAGAATALPAFAAADRLQGLVLIDSRLTNVELAGIPAVQRTHAKAIGHHDVLHWRKNLSELLAQGGSFTAYTRWDMALLLSDLGREAGRTPRRGGAGNAVEITAFEL